MSLKSSQIFLETHKLNFIKFLFPVLIWIPRDLVSPFLFLFWSLSFVLLVSPPMVLILGYPYLKWVSGQICYWWLNSVSSAQVNPLTMNKDINWYSPRCEECAKICGLVGFFMAHEELVFLVQRCLIIPGHCSNYLSRPSIYFGAPQNTSSVLFKMFTLSQEIILT